MSFKRLFSRALAAAPGRLHCAALSHHLWPDASFVGPMQAWTDGIELADTKWDKVFSEVIPEAQAHVCGELGLPDPANVVFSSNTHDFLIRLVSAWPGRPVRLLTTDGEFHSLPARPRAGRRPATSSSPASRSSRARRSPTASSPRPGRAGTT